MSPHAQVYRSDLETYTHKNAKSRTEFQTSCWGSRLPDRWGLYWAEISVSVLQPASLHWPPYRDMGLRGVMKLSQWDWNQSHLHSAEQIKHKEMLKHWPWPSNAAQSATAGKKRKWGAEPRPRRQPASNAQRVELKWMRLPAGAASQLHCSRGGFLHRAVHGLERSILHMPSSITRPRPRPAL